MTPRLHASGLGRLVACPGSYHPNQSSRRAPGGEMNTAAAEGDAAHWLAEQIWTGAVEGETSEDLEAPNGVVCDDVMRGHVLDYLEECHLARGRACQTPPSWFETKTDFECNRATVATKCDFATYDETTRTLRIIDFKYGYRPVEPENNWQLISYAFAWALTHDRFTISKVELTIYQPRAAHPLGVKRTATLSATEFADKWTELQNAVDRIGVDKTTSTGSHCRYCPMLPTCPAARTAGLNAVDVTLSTNEIELLNDEHLVLEIEALRRGKALIEERLPALEELAIARIEAGKTVPRLNMARLQEKRVWKDERELGFLETLIGIELHRTRPITVKQAEKKGVSEQILTQYAKTVPGRKVLTTVTIDQQAKGLFGDG